MGNQSLLHNLRDVLGQNRPLANLGQVELKGTFLQDLRIVSFPEPLMVYNWHEFCSPVSQGQAIELNHLLSLLAE